MSFSTIRKSQSPNVKIASKNIKNGSGTFIVDTGAELNLIKRREVRKGILINSEVKYHLFGITKRGVKTAGEVHVEINEANCPFHIVPDIFPMKGNGMLGMPFLGDSVIDLQTKTVKHALGDIPFTTIPKKRPYSSKLERNNW